MSSSDKSAESDMACRQNACCGGVWRFPLLLLAVLAAIFALNRFVMLQVASREASAPLAEQPATQTVSLSVDFGEGRRREWPTIRWRDGLTVADALAMATGPDDASEPLRFVQKGSGSSALLTELADVPNEGAGGRNWIYQVNGKHADRSFAVYELQAGDEVLWRYAGPD
jgi:hypothetical protein